MEKDGGRVRLRDDVSVTIAIITATPKLAA